MTPTPTNWTDDRCKDLEDLETLVREVRTINHGSSVIQRLIRCEELAEKLSRIDLEHLGFLRDLAINGVFAWAGFDLVGLQQREEVQEVPLDERTPPTRPGADSTAADDLRTPERHANKTAHESNLGPRDTCPPRRTRQPPNDPTQRTPMTTPTLPEAEKDLELTNTDIDNLIDIVEGIACFIQFCGEEDRSAFKTDLLKYRALLDEAQRIKLKIERHIETLKTPSYK